MRWRCPAYAQGRRNRAPGAPTASQRRLNLLRRSRGHVCEAATPRDKSSRSGGATLGMWRTAGRKAGAVRRQSASFAPALPRGAVVRDQSADGFATRRRHEFRQARSAGCGGKCRRGAAVPRRFPPKPDDPEDGSTFPALAFATSTVSSGSSIIAVCGATLSATGSRRMDYSWGDMRAWLDRTEPCILREMPVAGLALSRRNNATAGLAGSAVSGKKSVKLQERFP